MTSQYNHVFMLGDSMGATACLLFSHLATSVQAFCPQTDLRASSIRPGREDSWFEALWARLALAVERSNARITVHVGNWKHDLDQVCVRACMHVGLGWRVGLLVADFAFT